MLGVEERAGLTGVPPAPAMDGLNVSPHVAEALLPPGTLAGRRALAALRPRGVPSRNTCRERVQRVLASGRVQRVGMYANVGIVWC